MNRAGFDTVVAVSGAMLVTGSTVSRSRDSLFDVPRGSAGADVCDTVGGR